MVTGEAGKVVSGAVEAMKGTPVILALVIIIAGFLIFVAYTIGKIAYNAEARDKAQLQLIGELVRDVRECRTNDRRPERSMLFKSTQEAPR